MVIGSLTMHVHIFTAQCLKEKRRIIKSIIERVRHRFNAAVAEIDALDKYNLGIIGVAVVSNENKHAQDMLNQIIRLIQNMEGEFEITTTLIEII